MKKIPLSFLLVLFAALPAFAQTTAEEFFKIGSEQQRQNNYDAAINAFSECIRLKPDAVGCYQNRAAALLSKSKSAPLKPLAITAEALMGKTNLKLNIGGGSEVTNETRLKALADANKVIQMQPKLANAYFVRALIYAAEAIYDKAIADFRYGLTLDAKSEWAKGELVNAEKSHARRLGMSANAMFLSAANADAAGDKAKAAESYRKAVDIYTKALELDKTDGINLRGRAGGHSYLKNYEAAIADYTAALLIKSDDGDALIGRAKIYAAQKKTDFALADYETVLAMPMTSGNKYIIQEATVGRGKMRLDDGQTDAAIADFDKVLADNPQFLMALFYRGQAHAKKKNNPQAIADFRKALELVPYYEDAKIELAKLENKPRGATTQAAANTTTTPTTTALPQTAEQFAELGRRQITQKNYDAAVKSFTECLRLKPDTQGCYAFRGAVYGLKGDMTSSAADFDRAIKIDANFSGVYFVRAIMFTELGKKELATADLRTVLKIEPNNKQAQQALQKLGAQP